MNHNPNAQPERWILLGIPILFVVGSALHFAYGFLGELPLIGAVTPVNESVWEHAKMMLLPVILWWTLYPLFRGKRHQLRTGPWFFGGLLALLTALTVMPLLFYFYTSAFGTELLWVDILILLASLAAGQLLGLHGYRHSKGIAPGLALGIFALLLLLFILFTFFPPHIPLFQDGPSGGYGILP